MNEYMVISVGRVRARYPAAYATDAAAIAKALVLVKDPSIDCVEVTRGAHLVATVRWESE